jgi:phosphatidylserine/phosphatidylglycerophosphate/cardiolipin synthase-like enzyme
LNFTNYKTAQPINAMPNSHAVLDNATLLFGSHHQKVLIVRAGDRLVAYAGGMDLNPDRLHPKGVKGSNATGAPLHDVHLRIEGPAALDLLTMFSKRWHATGPTSSVPLRGDAFAPAGGAVAGPHLVQISHTYGRGYPYSFAVQTAKEALVNALRNAHVYAYMECQYFVGNEDLRLALRKALATVSEAVIVVIAPLDSVDDLPDLAFRRKEFIAPLKNDFPDKLLVFEHLGQPLGRTTPGAYVHAKLMLVDDEAAIVGTVNYSRRSWTHDSEVAATVVDSRGAPGLGPLPGFAALLRESLWADHLSLTGPEVRDLPTAVQKFRNLPPGARLTPYDHNQTVTRPNFPALVLNQYWDVIADPQG